MKRCNINDRQLVAIAKGDTKQEDYDSNRKY